MPFSHQTAAIVSVGDELTLGQTLDTNSQWLSARLGEVGVIVAEHVTVPDVATAQAEAFTRLAARVDLIICTGGLGPTLDDLTREALAAAMNDKLVDDPIALAQVEAFYAARNREMPAINAVQAQRPSRASILPNLHGTAPGIHGIIRTKPKGSKALERECEVFCLPGPPSEMRPMYDSQVLPRLRPLAERCVRTLVLHTIGLGESDIAMRLGPMMARDRVPLVGTTASGGVVSIRLRYEGPLSTDDADALLQKDERAIREKVGTHVFAKGSDTLASAIVHTLRQRGQTVALVESCTGGRLASLVTDVSGSSAVFKAGWIPYSNEAKVRDLGAAPSLFEKDGPGAVSFQTAHALATNAILKSSASFALAITGIAGPSGGSTDKPVGTVFIALAIHAEKEPAVEVRRFIFPGDRNSVREWSVRSALAMLWMHLNGTPEATLLRQVDRVSVVGRV
jgi:nicotinamide-nucleotide amidase